MDHRWGQRLATDVSVLVAGSGMTGIARVANVSLTGAYLETSVPLRLRSLVCLQSRTHYHAYFSGDHVAANVVRHDGLGVGLEWCEALTKHVHIEALLAMLAQSERHRCICGVGVESAGAAGLISHLAASNELNSRQADVRAARPAQQGRENGGLV
jgi:hypothetical protein